MRKLGTKNILSVFGDFRPVERRINNQKVSGWDLSEKSGESVEFENTYNDHVGGSISGKSELKADWQGASGLSSQVQTVQGKNLFDGILEKGGISVPNGNNFDSNLIVRTAGYVKVNPSTIYTISTNRATNDSWWIIGYTLDKSTVTNGTIHSFTCIIGKLENNKQSGTITTTNTTEYVRIYNYAGATTDLLQLELGSTATAYEPFVPNSPSPDYSSPVSPVHGKNLFDPKAWATPVTAYGLTIQYIASEDCFLINGTATITSGFALKSISIKAACGQLYAISSKYISGTLTRPNGTEYAVAYFGASNDLNTSFNWRDVSLYQYDTSTVQRINYNYITRFWFYIVAGVSFNNYKVKIQLEQSSTATAYEPYYSLTTGTTYKLPCPWGGYWEITLPIDFHGIGDYKDQLEVDLWTGKGRIRQNIGKKVFDGTEGIVLSATRTNTIRYNFVIADAKAGQKTNLFCTHLQSLNIYSVDVVGCQMSEVTNAFLPSLPKNLFPDVQSVKSFLAAQYAANPVTVYYVRSTPLITNLALTHVDSSTTPSLPLSSLNITTQTADYPSTIVSAGGEITSRGRNLINCPEFSVVVKSTTYAEIIPNGGAIFNVLPRGVDLSCQYKVDTDGELIPNGVGGNHLYFTFMDGSNYVLYTDRVGSLPPNKEIRYVHLYGSRQVLGATYERFYDIQVELGSTATPYVPYRQPSSILLPDLPGIPLASTATDYTYIDSNGVKYAANTWTWREEGIWEHVQRMGVKVFDGITDGVWADRTANINGGNGTISWFQCTAQTGAATYIGSIAGLCTSLPVADGAANALHCRLLSGTNVFGFFVPVTTIDNFRSSLAANPVTVYYLLATPIVTYLNLGELKSFPRYTHIEQLGDIKAMLNLNAKVYA